MDELLEHIGELNVMKKLTGDYIFYSQEAEYWKSQKVESVKDFEHWQAKQEYERTYRALGHRGYLPIDPDAYTAEQLQQQTRDLTQG
jgi:hypothetical protein